MQQPTLSDPYQATPEMNVDGITRDVSQHLSPAALRKTAAVARLAKMPSTRHIPELRKQTKPSRVDRQNMSFRQTTGLPIVAEVESSKVSPSL